MVRPFVDRLIALGVLPQPLTEDGYFVSWPDLNAPSDKDKADVAKTIAESLAKYVGGDVAMLIPPEEWLSMIMGMDTEQVKQIMESAEKYVAETEADRQAEEEEMRRRMEEEGREEEDDEEGDEG